MNNKIEKQLEEAKAHFYAWRMLDAYNILRRFFDRLPFQPDRKHAEFIGIFVRVLGELGRASELKFYVATLERHYAREKNPVIGFSLAVVYMNMTESRPEAARRLCEELLQLAADTALQVKVKMLLAAYYDRARGDHASVATIIRSIESIPDAGLERLWRVWVGKITHDEGAYDQAEAVLKEVALESEAANDWYAGFSAENMLAVQYIRQKRLPDAKQVIDRLRVKFKDRNFKTVQWQLGQLQSMLEKETQLGPLLFMPGADKSTFVYANRSLTMKKSSKAEQLLVMLLRKRAMDKTTIVRNLYNREYDAERDDKVVYYHIHSLRKRLKSIGVPSEAIVTDGEHYRWTSEVKTVGDEACA